MANDASNAEVQSCTMAMYVKMEPWGVKKICILGTLAGCPGDVCRRASTGEVPLHEHLRALAAVQQHRGSALHARIPWASGVLIGQARRRQ